MFNWRECYVGVLNMDHREDRLLLAREELAKLEIPFHRTRGQYPHEFDRNDPKLQVQWNRTPGSIGCMMGQIKIMQNALAYGEDVMVFEDDVILCSDIKERLDHIQDFLNDGSWDVFWLGGTVHIPQPVWRTGNNPDLPGASFHPDAEPTEDPRIIKCYSAFSTYAYIVNHKSIEQILRRLEDVMHLSMGIDWSFIHLGLEVESYMYLPGCAKQRDGISDIGNGARTEFSGFAKLGEYWFQDRAENFDPKTIQWENL